VADLLLGGNIGTFIDAGETRAAAGRALGSSTWSAGSTLTWPVGRRGNEG
jgi:hypothetical protein